MKSVEVKNWFIEKIYVNIAYSGLIKYKFLDLYSRKVFIHYIEKVARQIADYEGIKIYPVLFNEINKNEPVEKNKAVGLFRYLKGESKVEYERIKSSYKKLKEEMPEDQIYPRIEITEKGDVFTLIHELGHYFLYKADKVQSEENANLFFEEFFDKHLPPFFKWIYQIEIKVRTKKDRKFTKLECYNYLKEYKKFVKKQAYGN